MSTRTRLRVAFLAAVCVVLTAPGVGWAQTGPARADVTPLVETDGVHPGTTVRAAIRVRLPEGFHVNSNQPRDPSLIPIVLTVEPPGAVTVVEIVYPEPTDLRQQGVDQPLSVFEHEFAIGVRLKLGGDIEAGALAVPARLRYQACDETVCYLPATATTSWTLRVVPAATPVAVLHGDLMAEIPFGRGAAPVRPAPASEPRPAEPADPGDEGALLAELETFTVLGSAGGYLGVQDFLAFIRNSESGVREPGWFEGRGPLAILLIVFLGGLALNLTPCVLPMIPINLAIIGAGAQAGSRRRGVLLGATYGAAMAVVYGILGLVVILTATTFGTLNASPWFNAGIAVLFVALALAMFDVFAIDFSRFSNRVQVGAAGRGTFLVAFTMGGVAALLAGACVAPVVIQVVLFSSQLYTAGTGAALALPFVLGLGMALPWPIVGGGIAALPKPGAWMVRVKQVFGIVILATAMYYGYTAYGLFANRWVDPALVASSVDEKLKEGWHASLAEGLATARREQRPVLIDLWATWCKNCLTMDKTTLADPAVTAALAGYVKIKFQAEDPSRSPVREVMQHFGAVGLPAYVVLEPPSQSLVADVRAAIARQDLASGEEILAAYRSARGVTPEMLEALSWMGRGALAAGQWDEAEAYALETRDLALEALEGRSVDEEPHLPTALGAAIEVYARVTAERGARTEAVSFLTRALKTYAGTSIEKRIQKNILLLGLEGKPAPPIDVSEHLGPEPPTLDALKGKVVILFFWAHWCSDCKAQAPVLARLVAKYGQQGLTVLAPTQRYGYVAGGQSATADEEAAYIDQVRRTYFSVLAGQPMPLSETNHRRYGVSTTPTLVLVDREGVVRLYHPGRMTEEGLDPLVRRLVEGGVT